MNIHQNYQEILQYYHNKHFYPEKPPYRVTLTSLSNYPCLLHKTKYSRLITDYSFDLPL